MIEFALPLMVIAGGGYIASRFAMLAGWSSVSGFFRLLGLWAAAAWAGYSTPLYVALLCLPLGILWAKFESRWIPLIGFELLFGAALVWYSQTPPVIIFLVALAVFDQLAARLLLSRYNTRGEPRIRLHQFVLIAGLICCGFLVERYYRPPIETYVTNHSLLQIVNLQPEGAAPLWFYKRTLGGSATGSAQPGSVYWQSRYPETGENCALLFHGAASTASLQSTARTIGRAAIQAGQRLFAVDHPGFGASPAPSVDAPTAVWDPAHLSQSVLNQMALSGCTNTVVMGHSQGATEALRLFTAGESKVSSVLVFGAGLYAEDQEREDYWYSRFHIDRGLLNSNVVSREKWKQIRDLYYLNQNYCSDTPAGQTYLANLKQPSNESQRALKFVQFSREHENLVATRDQLFNCLSYPDVERQALPTDHYLDSLQVSAMVFFQRSSPQLVADLFPVTESSVDADGLATAKDAPDNVASNDS